MQKNVSPNRALRHLDFLAKLMDNQFSIPGTKFRFGLDPLIGLIPGVGDFAGFCVSGYMILIMAQNGASGFLIARMAFNVLLDELVGSIPLIGDLFDFGFKANAKNIRLMHQHYVEGRHKGGAWKVVVPLLILLFASIALIIWAVYKLFAFLIHLFHTW